MKNLKKIIAVILTMVMVLAMGSLTAFAAGTTGSITIDPPAGTPSSVTNAYKIYKVFDAVGNDTGVSYTVMESKKGVALPTGFTVDAAGNVEYKGGSDLDADTIAAIKTYIEGDAPVATVSTEGTTSAVVTGLPNGYYYITTSTGSVVTITTTRPNAEVQDKNEITPPTKRITEAAYKDANGDVVNSGSLDADGQKALASVGMTVSYEATVTKSKGAENYVFHDIMGSGLSYNGDVKVYIGTTEISGDEKFITTRADGDTLTVTFKNDYLKTLDDGTVFTIKYSATVTSDALTVDTGKNTASLGYGNNSGVISSPNTPTVYNAKLTVIKHDAAGKGLEGAGFVLKNADGKYYKFENNVVTWVDKIEDATVRTSDKDGNMPAFSGLANGTYTLVEKDVPEGYNKAADSNFTIKANDYTDTNLAQSTTVINKKGAELPSTGGMGTTIFYVIGAVLVLGAGVLLVARRRMTAK